MTRPSFSTTLPTRTFTQTYNDPTGSWTSYSDGSHCAETISGVSRRKPKGWIPPTGYNFFRREYSRAQGISHVSAVKTNWSKMQGCVGITRFNSHNHFNEVLTETTARQTMDTSAAIVAARLRLKNKRVDLGVAFAERKATSRMLGDTATRLARAVRSLRSGEFRNAARAIGIKGDPGKPRGSNWTNHWLQLQYGWKPLLSDIYGSCDALSKREQSDWRVTAKAYRSDEDTWMVERYPRGDTYPNGNFDGCRNVAVRKRGVFVRIDAIPENDLTMSLSSLGVTNPLLVAWELVPYSFVVDWAFPIGNWLDSLDALLGYGPAWTSVSTRNETLWTDTGLSREWSQYSFVRNDWIGTKRLFEVKRTASSGVPLAAFPRFKDPRSLGHMANGLSLLAQAFGRR